MSGSTVSVRVAAVACATALLLAAVTPASAAVKNVYNWPQLWSAYVSRAPGDEIILHPGVYNVQNGLYMTNSAGLTMRGSTGNAADVILRGPGMNTATGPYEAFQFVSPDMTLADLTIEGFYHHAIHFQPAADRVTVDNVVTLNIGSQHMKGAVNNDDLIIRNCKLYQTESRLERPGHQNPWNYIGGIDLHGARRAHIHDNLIMDIIGGQDGGDGGIFLWNASQDSIIERNVVIGASKGIELGNPSDQGLWQVQNTIVRNNFILSRPNEDIGLELAYTLNVEVYNNTIYRTGAPGSADWGRTVHIYDKAAHPTTNLTIENNIIRGGIRDNTVGGGWSSAEVAAMGNIVDTAGTFVLPEWFVDPDNLNLHLTELAIGAIDMATLLAAVPEDIDGGPRPVGLFPDMGADEYGSPAGDADYDGLVDGLDYTIWSNNYDQLGTWSDANFSGDALVDGLDYIIWSNNYGFGYPVPPSSGAVPEPGSLLLLAAGAVVLARRRLA